jgi:uncharacterized membrane-anchored protein YitT (DUF2179 family)
MFLQEADMEKLWQRYKWIFATLAGSGIFSAGFAFFLLPNDMSPGGISGLALVIVELLGFGSVGTLSVLINLPLFALGGMKIGKRFFFGSLLGMLSSSLMIDGFAALGLLCLTANIAGAAGQVICAALKYVILPLLFSVSSCII